MNEIDRIRLEEFHQFKKEIRGSAEYLLVGIDVAKDKHHAFMGTATGKTLLRRLVFETDLEGFRELLVQAEAVKVQEGFKRVVFAMEPAGNYHKPLGEHLIRCGHQVVLVSGVAAHENRKTLDGRWDTNDTRDAANVADLVSQGKCLFYEFPVPALQDLRNLLSLKRRFKRVEHGYRVRIRGHLLAKYFPELDRYYDQSSPKSLAIVRWCLDPSVIAGLEYKRFVEMVAPGKGRLDRQNRKQAIRKLAVDSIGCGVGPAVEFEAQLIMEGLKQIRQALQDIEEKIYEISSQFPEYEFLLSIPGFGLGFLQGSGGDWRSVSFSEWQTGIKGGRFRPQCGAYRENLRQCDPGHFQERESRSSVCLVPGGFHCFDQQSRLYLLLHQQATGPAKRAWDQDQDAGQVIGQTSDHCLDVMKKKEPFSPDYLVIE